MEKRTLICVISDPQTQVFAFGTKDGSEEQEEAEKEGRRREMEPVIYHRSQTPQNQDVTSQRGGFEEK